MAKKAKTKKGLDVKKLLDAAEELGAANNVGGDKIRYLMTKAFEKAYIRILTGGYQPEDFPDPEVKIEIDEDAGKIRFYQIKTIKKEVEDDMLEIELEDAQELFPKKKLNFEDKVEIEDPYIDINELGKIFIKQFKNSFHQQLNEVKKSVLYDTYKDRVGELVTGTVEKVEEKMVTVSIEKNILLLSKKDMIGDEEFNVGNQIKLYLDDVSKDGKGSIVVTRAAPGFLKRLFEDEIQEIYDGTIQIKGIARRAGKRSKVAVYSNDPDIDATGSCIGKDGNRINKIVNQIGKERIDIVAYSDDPALYIVDALRPAEVIGINIDKNDETGKEATCIVKDGQYSTAIGLRGINVYLAMTLTGFDFTILEETQAKEEGLVYTTKEELDAREAERLEAKKKSDFAKQSLAYKAEKEKEAEIRKYKENIEASKKEAKEKKEAAKVAEKKKVSTKTAASTLEEELAKVKNARERAEKREAEHVEIKTTTNISDLEKQLEQEKEENKKPSKPHRSHKNAEETSVEEEKQDETKEKKEEVKKMDIYTAEELRELDEEDNENNDDDLDDEEVDYDDYDEYYDDEK